MPVVFASPDGASSGQTLLSLQSYNFPDRFIRHRDYKGLLDPITGELDQSDATFRAVPGLAGNGGISLEASNFPNFFLVAEGEAVALRQRSPNDAQFDHNATFIVQPGLADRSAVSLESLAQRGSYLRHTGFVLFVHPTHPSDLFNADATFREVARGSVAVSAPATVAPPAPVASAPAAPSPVAAGPVAQRFPIRAGQMLERGAELVSSSGNHLIFFQDGGNLVITKKDKSYVWGFDRVQGLNFRQAHRVAVQSDGNFVALDASGGIIWRAPVSNPDPTARLDLSSRGGLQLISDSRGVLWASDGVMIPEGIAGTGFPFTAGQVIPPDVEFTSLSKKHVLGFQSSGNLVVASAGKHYLWGLDRMPNVDFKQIRSVRMSNDGNLVALGASGTPVWKALDANPDPASRLELSYSGALQLVSPSRGILWSSDGILAQPIRVDSNAAGLSDCQPESGWSTCVQMRAPTIKLMGSSRVSRKALVAAATVYTEIFARLKPAFAANSFDAFRVFMTNGESERELAALPVVGSMWTDGYGPRSRATLLGGASHDYLWIEEQMICKEGIVSRNADFAAGRTSSGDKAYRSYDQVIHEMAHSIDSRYKLMDTKLRAAYQGDPTEQFPQGVQAWFGAPVREFSAREKALLDELFTSRAVFSCEGISP